MIAVAKRPHFVLLQKKMSKFESMDKSLTRKTNRYLKMLMFRIYF